MKGKFFCYTLVPLLLLLLKLNNVSGFECNVCSESEVACVSETEFQFCTDGVPEGTIFSCGTDYVCSTANSTFCLARADDVLISCSGCNECDANGVFACTGIRSFALCYGGTTPASDSGGNCAANYVCNVNSAQICVVADADTPTTCNVDEVTTTTEATTTEATTVAPITDAKTYCQNVQQAGRFDAGDANCKKYVLCFVNGGVWNGQIYTCAGSTYYNDATQLCVSTLPSRCSASVTTTTGSTTTLATTSSSTATTIASTTITTTISTTPSESTSTSTALPLTDPTAYCQSQQQTSRFDAGDGNCRQYIYCFVNGGVWGGQVYTCPRLTYFDTSSQLCVEDAPAGCGDA